MIGKRPTRLPQDNREKPDNKSPVKIKTEVTRVVDSLKFGIDIDIDITITVNGKQIAI
jgi:hypothetical protein